MLKKIKYYIYLKTENVTSQFRTDFGFVKT